MPAEYGCACRWVADRGDGGLVSECATHAALREENARLTEKLDREHRDHHPYELDLLGRIEKLTRERDEARERVEVCLRVNENVGKELLAADAEVARLEGLILQVWEQSESDDDALRQLGPEAARIRAQREEGQHVKHPTGDYCVWCHSQWPCEESSEEGK